MFEKESNQDDFTTINLDNYQQDKHQSLKCPISCNPIVLFILTAFLFISIGVLELISNYSANKETLTLNLANNTHLILPQATYLSFPNSQKIAIYLKIQNLTQFDHYQQIHSRRSDHLNHLQGDCSQYRLNQNMGKTVAVDGSALNPTNYAIPCGYFAGLFPVETISVSYINGSAIPIVMADLSNFQSNDQNINLSQQWVDLNNPVFQSWMEINSMISTFKLVGHIPSFQGQIDISITLPEGIPKELGSIELIMEEVKVFGHTNIPFVSINFLQSFLLFIFSLAIFLYNKLISQQIEQSKTSESQQNSSKINRKIKINSNEKQKHMLQLHSVSERQQISAKSS